MPTNHLLIALGGTGGRMLYAFRRMLHNQCKAFEPPTANVRYLYIDSSTIDIQAMPKNYPIIGGSTRLADTSVKEIPGNVGLRAILDNPHGFPTISSWLGSRDNFASILNNLDPAKTEAAQVRRLGRVLFAQSLPDIRRLVTQHVQSLRAAKREGIGQTNEVVMHFLCGLAGGTGSGSIVDAVAQARATFPDNVKILIYAFLPERYPVPEGKAGPRYHINAYAALRELSALSVGAWMPHDLRDREGQRFRELSTPFDACYLFTNENRGPEGHSVTLDPSTETPELAAAFLYQRICEAGNLRWAQGGNVWQTQESYMVGGAAVSPETASHKSNRPLRSRRFFSFGIKTIEFPETEIEEYLTYMLAASASRQMTYNHWKNDQGYLDKSLPVDHGPVIQSPSWRTAHSLTEGHFTLELPITENEAKLHWGPFEDYWLRLAAEYSKEAIAQEKFPNQMGYLRAQFELVYRRQFRNEGVAAFFERMGSGTGVRAQAEAIRQKIESGLLEEWRLGRLPALALDDRLKELLPRIDEWIEDQRAKAAATHPDESNDGGGEILDLRRQIEENERRYVQCGIASRAVRTHERLVTANSDLYAHYYSQLTRHHGHLYASNKLLPLVKSMVQRLKDDVASFAKFLSDQTKAMQGERDARCKESEANDLRKQTVKHYEVKAVKRMSEDIERDRPDMEANAAAVREAALCLREPFAFSNFGGVVREEDFRTALERTCKDNALKVHDGYVGRNPGAKMVLGISVLEDLERRYGANPTALQEFATEVMRTAANFLPIDDRERSLQAPGVPDPNDATNAICHTTNTVILPEGGRPEFRKALEEAFRSSCGGQLYVAANTSARHQLSIVRITNVMPARFAQIVKFCRDEYLKFIRLAPKEAGKIFLEGDGSSLPDLYPTEFSRDHMIALFGLAEEFGLLGIRETEDGRTCYHTISLGRFGEEKRSPLAETADESMAMLKPEAWADLAEEVGLRLQRDYWHEMAKKKLIEQLEEKTKSQLPGLSDTGREACYRALDAAVQLIEKTKKAEVMEYAR